MTTEELHVKFSVQALTRPDAPAVISLKTPLCSRSTTYAQLWWQACSFATNLQKRTKLAPGDLVGIYCKSSLEAIVAILGTLIAGAVYVPFDPSQPAIRNQSLFNCVKDELRAMVVQGSTDELKKCLPRSSIDQLLVVVMNDRGKIQEMRQATTDGSQPALERIPSEETKPSNQGLAYVMFTSGTTGEPKCVRVQHSSVIPNIRQLSKTWFPNGDGSGNVTFLSSPLTFDPSVIDIFVTLSSGGCLLIVPPRIKASPMLLLKAITEFHVTVIQCTPSLFMRFSQYQRYKILRQLKVLALGGERFPNPNHIHPSLIQAPCTYANLSIYNLYGTTEVSVWGMIAKVFPPTSRLEADDGSIPLGVPMDDTIAVVRDVTTHDVISSGVGELWLARQVPGVLANTMPTGDLVKLWPNGAITYEGRRDHQVKINGVRVNPEFVERILLQLPGVVQASVMYHESSGVMKAYVVSQLPLSKSENVRKLVGECKSRLPPVMVPTIYLVASLPVNANGKVDLNLLRTNYASPCSESFSKSATAKDVWDVISDFCRLYLFNIEERDSDEESRPAKKQKKESKDSALPKLEPKSYFTEFGSSIDAIRLLDFVCSHFGLSQEIEINKDLLQTLYHSSLDNFVEDVCKALANPANCITLTPFKLHSSSASLLIQTDMIDYGTVLEWRTWRHTGSPELNMNINNNHPSEKNWYMKVKWRYYMGKCLDSSPLVVTRRHSDHEISQIVYIGSHSKVFTATTLETGMPIWSIELGGRIDSSAILSRCGKYVVVGCYDGFLYVIDALLGTIKWRFQTNGEIRSSPCLDTDTGFVWIGSYDGWLYCLDIDSETCAKRYELGSFILSTPVIDQKRSKLYVGSHGKTFFVLSTDQQKSGILRIPTQAPIFSTPAISPSTGNVAFGCCDKSLYCITPEGEKVWSCQVEGPIFSSPLFFYSEEHKSSVIAVGSHDGSVYLISETTGEIASKVPLNGGVYSSVAALAKPDLNQTLTSRTTDMDGVLCACTMPGQVALIDITNGSVLSELELGGGIFQSSPVVVVANSPSSSPASASPFSFSPLSTPTSPTAATTNQNAASPLISSTALTSFEGAPSTPSSSTLSSSTLPTIPSSPLLPESSPKQPVQEYCILIGCRDDYLYCLRVNSGRF